MCRIICQKIGGVNYQTVIVDNASSNGSGKQLSDKYLNDDKVNVVLNDKNLGFSAGLNAGINFLKENYICDYIILSNNDIEIFSKDFFAEIEQIYKETEFAVLGPMVLQGDGKFNSNPIFELPYTREAAEWQLKQYKDKLKRYKSKFYPINLKVNSAVSRIKRRIVREKRFDSASRRSGNIQIHLNRQEGMVLHGCFLVLSKKYFEVLGGLDERTFLYAEEDILWRNCEKHRLKMVYDPQVVVYHSQGSATKTILKNSRKKTIFITEQQIKAVEGYLKMLNELDACR